VIVKWSKATPSLLGFWRLILAGCLIAGYQLYKQKNFSHLSFSIWSLVSGLLFFLHLWTYMLAAHNTSIAHMVIIYATNPIYAMIGGQYLFGEKIPTRIYWTYPIAFIGIFILMAERFQLGFSLFGNIMALVSAVFHAGYFLATKKSRQTQTNLNFSMVLYLTAGLGFFILSIISQNDLFILDQKSWIAILLLILFPTFLGHFLMTYLMKFIPIAKLSFSKLTEPGMSTLIAYLVLGEKISLVSFLAFILTLAAVMIAISEKPKNQFKY
jgi:drug/metabolite transporter (DMT)-like permease